MSKNRKYRVPKKMAGVRIPKRFRRTTEDALLWPGAREAMAVAMLLGGAYLVSRYGTRTRRMVESFAGAGSTAGKYGAETFGQALHMLMKLAQQRGPDDTHSEIGGEARFRSADAQGGNRKKRPKQKKKARGAEKNLAKKERRSRQRTGSQADNLASIH